MNIAIRSPNWIGDGVMSLPAIRALKSEWPQSRLHIIAREPVGDLYQNIPEISEVIPIPERLPFSLFLATARALRRKKFSLGILLPNSFQSALLFRLAGIANLIGFNRDGRGLLLRQRIRWEHDDAHHSRYYLKIMEILLQKELAGNDRDRLVVSNVEKVKGQALLTELSISADNLLIGLAPGAAYGSAKAWPWKRFTELARLLKETYPPAEILIFGSGKEKELAEIIASGPLPFIHNLAGRLTLRESIILLSFCRLVIANDSGLMHIASALRVPLIGLFGPTLPQKTAPLSPAARILYHPVACAPCRQRECSNDRCCLTAITVAEVLAVAGAFL